MFDWAPGKLPPPATDGAKSAPPLIVSAGPALELRGITKRFPGVVANDSISFRVEAGEVHGVLGQNGAGKTTLMNIIAGLQKPDAGSLSVRGVKVEVRSPQHAAELGIGMVHQQFSLVPDMTVSENLILGPSSWPKPAKLNDVRLQLLAFADQFDFDVDPDSRVEDLSVGSQQRVEILKALYRDARILILDEPTAVLTPSEWMRLATFLRAFAAQGRSVIFITHKLHELFHVADRCTILRNGAVVATVPMAEASRSALTAMMVGKDVPTNHQQTAHVAGRAVLSVENLTVTHTGRRLIDGISFEIREGEVLGVAGVAGNGQDVLVEALVGLRARREGSISVGGVECERMTPREFRSRGGGIIPEDRRAAGMASTMSVWENLVMDKIGESKVSRRGFVRKRHAINTAGHLISEYKIKTVGPHAEVRQLSGGNQQKVVLARELGRNPAILLACQPTRGLDVEAAAFVWERLLDCSHAGTAILLISAELEEIFALSHRIAVMLDGKFVSILDRKEATLESVGLLMAGEGRAIG